MMSQVREEVEMDEHNRLEVPVCVCVCVTLQLIPTHANSHTHGRLFSRSIGSHIFLSTADPLGKTKNSFSCLMTSAHRERQKQRLRQRNSANSGLFSCLSSLSPSL